MASGEPITKLNMQLPRQIANTSPVAMDSDGYASFSVSRQPEYYEYVAIVGQQGSDSVMLPVYGSQFRNRMYVSHRVHVFSDRYLYQPGEEVRIKGWVREVGITPTGDVSWASADLDDVAYSVSDARGVLLDQGQTGISPHGAFDIGFRVPMDANSGLGTVKLRWAVNFKSMHPYEAFRRLNSKFSLSVGERSHLIQDPYL